MDFFGYTFEEIIGGKTADNLSLLELFLKEYETIFKTKVNAGCSKCLKNYYNNYKKKIMKNVNSNYKLKQKYNGIPLEFGSNIFVNNENITDAFAEKLLERFDAEKIFEIYPAEQIEVKDAEEVKPKKNKKNITSAGSEVEKLDELVDDSDLN